MVDREGDVFVIKKRAWRSGQVLFVLNLRARELQNGCPFFGEGPDVILADRHARFRINRAMYERWLLEPDTVATARRVWERAREEGVRRRQEGQRVSTMDLYNRSMQSYWKSTLFHRFGGEIWFGLLSMCGRVPLVLIEIVNEIFMERIREKESRAPTHQAMPLTGAPLARATHASSQGQQPREVRGVQHTTAVTKQLRERAQLRSKHAKWHDEE